MEQRRDSKISWQETCKPQVCRMGGTSCVRTRRHGLQAVVMVSMKWPHVGSTTLALQTDNRTVILTVSVDERSDHKEI